MVEFLKRPWLCSEWNTSLLFTKLCEVYTLNCLLFFKDDKTRYNSESTKTHWPHCMWVATSCWLEFKVILQFKIYFLCKNVYIWQYDQIRLIRCCNFCSFIILELYKVIACKCWMIRYCEHLHTMHSIHTAGIVWKYAITNIAHH